MKHKKVVSEWYEVNFSTSHRYLGGKIDEFLSDSPEIGDEEWQDNHTILRDYEGDFDGVLIYNNEDTAELIKWICEKLEIDYEEFKGLDFKLVG